MSDALAAGQVLPPSASQLDLPAFGALENCAQRTAKAAWAFPDTFSLYEFKVATF
jgi:hypothetical protein